jgi:hypothetical protein|tara:strand:+ start:356 stop:673 length:318 start_codon:yes stop_codon:yes gene_type:complete
VPKNKLPPEVIKHWPEIFGDVEIKAVPIEYIHNIHVHFHDGKIWEIDLDQQSSVGDGDVNIIENSLETFLEQYNDEISHVDFRLNTSKVVADVKKRTKSFMKKRK